MNESMIKKYRNKFMSRDKKILIGIISVLSIIISVIFSFSIIFDLYIEYALKKCDECNTYFVALPFSRVPDEEEEKIRNQEVEKIRNIDHVVDVYRTSESEAYPNVKEIGDTKVSGNMRIMGLSKNELKEMSDGKYQNDNDVICPSRFYPNTGIEYEPFVSRFEGFDMKRQSNNKIKISLYNYKTQERREKELNVVGTFKNSIINYDDFTCYASRELISESFLFQSPNYYDPTTGGREDVLISIDSIDNFEYVKKEIKKLGYLAFGRMNMDYTLYYLVKSFVPLLIIISVIIVSLFICIIAKRNQENKMKEYKILKSLGMNDDEYKKLQRYETNYIMFFGVLISFISVMVVYVILNIVVYFFPFILLKLPLDLHLLGIIIFYVIIYLIMHLVNNIYFNKLKKI